MEELKTIRVLTSSPPCPECDRMLKLRTMPGQDETPWHCIGCGTQWRTGDLIDALNLNAKIAWALSEPYKCQTCPGKEMEVCEQCTLRKYWNKEGKER